MVCAMTAVRALQAHHVATAVIVRIAEIVFRSIIPKSRAVIVSSKRGSSVMMAIESARMGVTKVVKRNRRDGACDNDPNNNNTATFRT